MKLSNFQKITRFFSSKKKFIEIEKESRSWQFQCKSCSHISNIWEIGGVRYKAKGNPRVGIKCQKCKKRGMLKLQKNLTND